jgi:hypothetical protein
MPYAKDLAEELLKQEDIECIKPSNAYNLRLLCCFFQHCVNNYPKIAF